MVVSGLGLEPHPLEGGELRAVLGHEQPLPLLVRVRVSVRARLRARLRARARVRARVRA